MLAEVTAALTQDVIQKTYAARTLGEHREAAIEWLKRTQDVSPDAGAAYGFYLRGRPFRSYGMGWRPSYVETSGYIVETLYDIDAANRAERMGRWLVTMQNKDGSFCNASLKSSEGIVFDTGQVLFGLLRCFKETQDNVFKHAAERAVSWLASHQDEDGAWRNNTYQNAVHSYNTRTAWAMLEYCAIFPNQRLTKAAKQNLMWAVGQQAKNGLIQNCGFKKGDAPYTHTIAYAIRGLYEGGHLLADQRALTASYRAAKAVSKFVDVKTGFLPGRISTDGTSKNKFACLTGNCQMASIWYKMSEYFEDERLLATANKALDYVLKTHDIDTKNENIRGAVKGSHPIWGNYAPLAYPNWATKFLIDALLIRESLAVS